ncbi:MAG: gliding motility-associated ABC transporter ATP-binding subunit GldA, partial [Ignavibacteriales bacterium CG_4_9_14_3_um_filter_34_10]
GEILGFLGPNGAGKTTTMKILTCYESPSAGEVTIGNLSIFENAEEIKKIIGYLPENNPLYNDMSVMDYLKFAAEISGIEKQKINDRIAEMILLTDLNAEKHKTIFELSKGYKQRVGLAQALIHDPKILILDEPTSGLDPNQIVEIRKLIKEIGREKTVILSTHILSEVEATCDRIIIINKGKIVADGTADSLKKKSQSEETLKMQLLDVIDSNLVYEELNSIPFINSVDLENHNNFIVGCTNGLQVRREIFQLCVKNNWVLSELTSIETKLEDIFRDLTL